MADLEKGLRTLNLDEATIRTADDISVQPPSPVKFTSSGLWRLLQRSPKSDATATASVEFIEAEDEREPVIRKLEECPEGYPQLAAFLDSDDNFMVYRRFGYLHARMLLKKQEQLRQLEIKLEGMDLTDQETNAGRLSSMADYETKDCQERKELEEAIEKMLLEYDALFQSALGNAHCSRPSSAEYRSVENFVSNRQPLIPSEQSFVYHKEDLVTLRPGREHAWLDSSVERMLKWFKCDFVQRIFCSKEKRKKTDGAEVYYSRERIEAFVVSLIVLMILVLLVVPIYVLYQLTVKVDTAHANAICIGVLLIATLAFSACVSLFTRAKRHEILAAAAAYCAVLVVFIGNVGGVNTGHSFIHT